LHRPPRSPLFPYTTLFRSRRRRQVLLLAIATHTHYRLICAKSRHTTGFRFFVATYSATTLHFYWLKGINQTKDWKGWKKSCLTVDRKSTRLNSSHVKISYA